MLYEEVINTQRAGLDVHAIAIFEVTFVTVEQKLPGFLFIHWVIM